MNFAQRKTIGAAGVDGKATGITTIFASVIVTRRGRFVNAGGSR